MIKQFSLFTEHKKTIIILLISMLVISSLVYGIVLYRGIIDLKTKDYEGIHMTFKEKLPDANVIEINRYHGDELYHVILAELNQEQYYYILPSEKDADWYSFPTKELHSRQQAMDDWKNRCDNCQYLHDEIGMDKGYIVLEVNYKNKDGHFVIEHILLEDLSNYKLTLKRSLEQ